LIAKSAHQLASAREDLIENTSIKKIDLGFGEPAFSHSSTNVVESRASLLLFRETLPNRLLSEAHSKFRSFVEFGKSCLIEMSSSVKSR
jgi:hypothetical protein